MVVTVRTSHLYFKAEASRKIVPNGFEAGFKVYPKEKKKSRFDLEKGNLGYPGFFALLSLSGLLLKESFYFLGTES